MKPIKTRAKWIWRYRGLKMPSFAFDFPLIKEEKNRFVYFRKTFEINEEIKAGNILVSADGRYRLFVNGQLVGRGPAPCSPEFQSADAYNIKPFLKKGKNVIAALAHSYGRNTSWYELPKWEQARAFGCGGFFLQGDVKGQKENIILNTGKSWKYKESDAWEHDVPSTSLGFREIFNASNEPTGWNLTDFDDTQWANPEELAVGGRHYNADIIPFPALYKRDIPLLIERELSMNQISIAGEVHRPRPLDDLPGNLQDEEIYSLKNCTIEDPENLLNLSASKVTKIQSSEPGKDVSFVFDLGEIVNGRLFFEIDAPSGCFVDITFGEKQRADKRVTMQKGIPGEFEVPHAHRYITKTGIQSWEQFEWYGFHYIQITFRNITDGLIIRRIGIKNLVYTEQQPGTFSCSDSQLNKIWLAGVKTVNLCMTDSYNDCPTREQRQWVGDVYVIMPVNMLAFGDSMLTARMLRQIAQSQLPNGLLMMSAPGDFAITPFTNIPEFSLYWIMIADRYYMQTADTALIDEIYPSMLRVVEWFFQWENDEGLLENIKHWMFIDWAEVDKDGALTAVNAQFVKALKIVSYFSGILKFYEKEKKYKQQGDKIARVINQLLWDEKRGVYVDARKNGINSQRISQQSNAAVVAFDVAPEERYNRIFNYISDNKRVVLTGSGLGHNESLAFNNAEKVVESQPFYSHILHQAYRKMGKQTQILKQIRKKWGKWVNEGYKTWPETWQMETITSTCHGWSSTPTFDLTTDILGIQILKAGFEEILIRPACFNLSWAKGTFPTSKGLIKIEWKKQGAVFEILLKIPKRIKAKVVLPKSDTFRNEAVVINGKAINKDKITLGPGEYRIIKSANQ